MSERNESSRRPGPLFGSHFLDPEALEKDYPEPPVFDTHTMDPDAYVQEYPELPPLPDSPEPELVSAESRLGRAVLDLLGATAGARHCTLHDRLAGSAVRHV
ncbi:MAG: hypothetical protein QOH97_2603 [Actinoplanes sp.]|jgi:hypothetical protein|nr:hypothetical protein [Actinoplanes sp.]